MSILIVSGFCGDECTNYVLIVSGLVGNKCTNCLLFCLRMSVLSLFSLFFQAVLDSLLLTSVSQLSLKIRQSVDKTAGKIRWCFRFNHRRKTPCLMSTFNWVQMNVHQAVWVCLSRSWRPVGNGSKIFSVKTTISNTVSTNQNISLLFTIVLSEVFCPCAIEIFEFI